jgi:hypothetical protein
MRTIKSEYYRLFQVYNVLPCILNFSGHATLWKINFSDNVLPCISSLLSAVIFRITNLRLEDQVVFNLIRKTFF